MSNEAPTATLEELLAHVAWVRRLARRLTADAADAEDLLQETWMAAARHPPTSDRPLRPWLAVVLRNLWRTGRLAARRREARHAALAGEAVDLSPERLAEQVEGQRLLAELVAGLDEPYRQALVLRYFEDLSGAEIARRLGVPAGTVRWRLKVALDELRRRLDERHGGRRAVWTAALLPLAGPATLRPRMGSCLAIGLAGATLALGLGLTRCAVDTPASARGLGAQLAAVVPAGRVPAFRLGALPAVERSGGVPAGGAAPAGGARHPRGAAPDVDQPGGSASARASPTRPPSPRSSRRSRARSAAGPGRRSSRWSAAPGPAGSSC